jgi:hypothetical protein
MEPNKIPNVQFGYFGHRHTIRLFFPRLQSPDRHSVKLTAEELQRLYDLAIRPAAVAVMPDIVADWPGSFNTAEWKDRNSQRGFSHSTYLIPQGRMHEFGRKIRSIINSNGLLTWARDFFWGVEIRGVKDMCSHSIAADADEMTRCHNLVLNQVDTTNGTWYGDIGLQFMLEGEALLWSTNGHRQLLQHLLDISSDEAHAIISNPRCYSRDITTHIMSLSGFHCDFTHYQQGDGVGPLSIAYVQAYQSDKSQTYHPEGSRFGKTITAKIAVQGNPPPWCQSLLRVYGDAARRVDVSTRFEARVPLAYITDALISVRMSAIKRTMACYKRALWW